MKLPVVSPTQESYLAPEFLEMVKYCREDGASEEGLLELITTEAGMILSLCICPSWGYTVECKKVCVTHNFRQNIFKGNGWGYEGNDIESFETVLIYTVHDSYLQPTHARHNEGPSAKHRRLYSLSPGG